MMLNVSEFHKLIKYLFEEYNAQVQVGRKASQIRIRLDCVLSGLRRCYGVSVKGSPEDIIREI